MTTAYRIKDWHRYMPADAKKCSVMQWVAIPINHDGMGYIEIMARPDGVRIVGGWLLILQVAARCPERGLLVSDGGRVLRAREIALKTRSSEDDISAALAACLEQEWIEEVEVSGCRPDAVRMPSRLQDRTGQDITEQDKTEREAGKPATPEPKPAKHRRLTPVRDNPPTIREVVAYADERIRAGFGTLSPYEFFDRNEAAGWVHGRNGSKDVVDWRAHYRAWDKPAPVEESTGGYTQDQMDALAEIEAKIAAGVVQ